MRSNAGKIGIAGLYAVALAGCDSVPDLSWDHPDRVDIQTLAMSQASACRFITDVGATSSYIEGQDMQLVATRKIFALAAEKGGNAVQIVSTSVATSSGMNKPTITTVSAKVYSCNPGPGEITQ